MGSVPGERALHGHLARSSARLAKEGSAPQASAWQALEAPLLLALQVALRAPTSAAGLCQEEARWGGWQQGGSQARA